MYVYMYIMMYMHNHMYMHNYMCMYLFNLHVYVYVYVWCAVPTPALLCAKDTQEVVHIELIKVYGIHVNSWSIITKILHTRALYVYAYDYMHA
jgi:hypothetical protein